MSDEIFIKDLEVFAKHGVYNTEKAQLQKFLLSIRAQFDASEAKKSDDINETVNYSELIHVMANFVKDHSYNLIEKLAKCVADEIFSHFPKITHISLEISKFPQDLESKNFAKIGFYSKFSRNE